MCSPLSAALRPSSCESLRQRRRKRQVVSLTKMFQRALARSLTAVALLDEPLAVLERLLSEPLLRGQQAAGGGSG